MWESYGYLIEKPMVNRSLLLAFTLLLTGCDSSPDFRKHNQNISGPIELTGEWLHVTPDRPLTIEREGVQELHLAFDGDSYELNYFHIEGETDDPRVLFALRGQEGQLVRPEVVLIADDGTELALTPVSHHAPPAGGVTIGFGMFDGMLAPPPPFPEAYGSYVSFKVRSDQPVSVEYFRWLVSYHPDMPR